MKSKKVVILGSTGSIGTSAVKLFKGPLKDYTLLGISGNENVAELSSQVKLYKPKYVVLPEKEKAEAFAKKHKGIKVLSGIEGLVKLATLKEADIILISVVGAVGMVPLLAALRAGKKVALANKEALIIAGDIITKEAKKHGAELIPVDSEHNAIFQALQGNKKEFVKKLIITASGGPFKNKPKEELGSITVEQALDHPTWKMGKKITIDSATLMNKGLEVIEAHYLFDIPYEKIEVVIHPQSIVHSMVEYIDGSVMAQMSNPDMTLPIQYALTYPERRQGTMASLDLIYRSRLDFHPVDFEKFRAFSIALSAGKKGGTAPACMNAANEIAVRAFLDKKIKFGKIPELVERALKEHKNINKPTIEQILKTDLLTRQRVTEMIEND